MVSLICDEINNAAFVCALGGGEKYAGRKNKKGEKKKRDRE